MVALRGSWGVLTSRETYKGSACSMGFVDCKLSCSILRRPLLIEVIFGICLVMSW